MAAGAARPALLARRPAAVTGRRVAARAEPFNEGAAQVRRLLDRDRKELDYDELEASFGAQPDTPRSASEADAQPAPSSSGAPSAGPPRTASPFTASSSAASVAAKAPVSPFGPASSPAGGGASPFGPAPGGAPARKPFAEPAGLSPSMQPAVIKEDPWWSKITLTQVAIVLSFATTISLMFVTFFFVLGTGAIHFND
eukprot:scaffold5.g659.t1